MISVGILGATGYTGVELARWLVQHPQIKVSSLTSEKSAGQPYSHVFPAFQGVLDQSLEKIDLDLIAQKTQCCFLCLPHSEAMETAAGLLQRGVTIIDLSADFRLRSPELYQQWYGAHLFPNLLAQAAYGLPELYRAQIRQANLIANPGCYPTSVALALAPLLKNKLVKLDSIVIDSKSGVSGAGRNAKLDLLFGEVNEGFKAYQVGGVHRHIPEIEQTLSDLAQQKVTITFTPHLLPITRGILTTIYCKPREQTSIETLRELFDDFYRNEPFVRVKPIGVQPNVKEVQGTNFCDLAPFYDSRTQTIVLVSVIDNLAKGAASQALQNFNLKMGFEETLGLKTLPVIP